MIDASALLAILLGEPDAGALERRVRAQSDRFTTPVALTEVSIRLMRIGDPDGEQVRRDIELLLGTLGIEVRELHSGAWKDALSVFARYGRGRHLAALNFGDCLAYAASRHHRAPLIYKGADFALTDVNDGY